MRTLTRSSRKFSIGLTRNLNAFIVQPNDDYSLVFSVVVKQTGPAPALEEWGLIASECLHHTRAALDNLVYAICRASGTTWPMDDRALKRLSFPLIGRRQRLAVRRLQGRHADVRPSNEHSNLANRYIDLNQELPPLLAVLRDGNDWDKAPIIG
jgi:hypothetical protein